MDTVTRRRFLIASGVVGGGALAAGATRVHADRHPGHRRATATAAERRTLVLVTLYGGNDGLNTVIPYADPAYHDARPELAYTAEEVLRLDDAARAEPGADRPAQRLYDAEQLADRPRRRLPEAGPQPLPVDGHLADRAAGPARQHRLARPLARRGRRRPAARGVLRAGAAAAAGRRDAAPARRCRSTGLQLPDGRASRRRWPRSARPSSRASRPLQARAAACFADLRRGRRDDHARCADAAGRRRRTDGDAAGGDRHRRRAYAAGRPSSTWSRSASRPGVSTRVFSVSLGGFDTHADEKRPQDGCCSASWTRR